MIATFTSLHALRDARLARGWSQRALATRIGLSRQSIAAIEAGRTAPSLPVALALSRALGASVERLFGDPADCNVEAAASAADGLRPGTRVALGRLGGRISARPLGPADGGADAVERCDGIVAGLGAGRALVTPFSSDARRRDRVVLSGCDLSLGLLARHAARRTTDAEYLWFPVDNRRALDDLSAGRAHAAAMHVDDLRAWEATVAAGGARVRRYVIADMEEGWMVGRGNPCRLRAARDLLRSDVHLVNRPVGSGARALLDAELRRAGIDPAHVDGYAHAVDSPLDAARAVAQGFVDVAVGSAAAARWYGLDFLPLRGERCMLVVPEELAGETSLRALLDTLRSPEFRRELDALGGYETARMGTAS